MFYPAGFFVALMPDGATASAAAADLRDKSFGDVREFTPQELLEHTEQIKANRSFFDRLSVALSESEVPAALALSRVQQGCHAVLAQANSEDDVKRLRELMARHPANMTAYWGKWRVSVYNA